MVSFFSLVRMCTGKLLFYLTEMELHTADNAEAKSLDSSVKRNSALIKKLRQLSEETKEALLLDISRTNQSKYVSEAVAAVTEASVKSKDIPAAIQICSALHQRYSDFCLELVTGLSKVLAPKSGKCLAHQFLLVQLIQSPAA